MSDRSNILSEPSFERVALERVKIGVSERIPRYVLDNLELGIWEDHAMDTLVTHFRSEVLAKTLGTAEKSEAVYFEAPASWWQMFKATYALSWWLSWLVDRWPVRYETHTKWATVTFATQAAFPDATVRFPKELGNPIIVNRVL